MVAFSYDLQEYTIRPTGRISASIGRQFWARGVAHPAAAARILPKGVQKGVHHYTVVRKEILVAMLVREGRVWYNSLETN